MSDANKNRLEVQQIVKGAVSAGLAAMGYGGWTVQEFASASFQSADKVVLINLIRSARVGWQASSLVANDDYVARKDEWIEEQSWQIHCINRREGKVTGKEVLAEDIAGMLVTWFNGPGCDYLRMKGCASLRIDGDSIIVYNDNSDLYQKRAVFTVKIQVPKELTTGDIALDAIIPTVKPI